MHRLIDSWTLPHYLPLTLPLILKTAQSFVPFWTVEIKWNEMSSIYVVDRKAKWMKKDMFLNSSVRLDFVLETYSNQVEKWPYAIKQKHSTLWNS